MQEQLVKFRAEQLKWQAKIKLKNSFKSENLRLVAGVDLAYWKANNKEYGVCCIVLVDYQTKQVVEEVHYSAEINVPYLPGYLAFRELPLVIEASKKLIQKPDLYMFDGNGYLHPQHMGIATHSAFYLNSPTIGVAKSYFKVSGADYKEPQNQQGAFEMIQANQEIYGLALRTTKNVKPIYVSCGNDIDLVTAKEITLHFITHESRLPITTRYADIATHLKRKEYLKLL